MGYRIKVPELKSGYTLTTMHRETASMGSEQLVLVDSDLSGNGWLYQRPEDKNLNPERDLFDRTDPKAVSYTHLDVYKRQTRR